MLLIIFIGVMQAQPSQIVFFRIMSNLKEKKLWSWHGKSTMQKVEPRSKLVSQSIRLLTFTFKLLC